MKTAWGWMAGAMALTLLAGGCSTAKKEAPPTIAQHEVDGINIITRWIYRHSDERTFIPLHDKPGTTLAQALVAVIACREATVLPLPE